MAKEGHRQKKDLGLGTDTGVREEDTGERRRILGKGGGYWGKEEDTGVREDTGERSRILTERRRVRNQKIG